MTKKNYAFLLFYLFISLFAEGQIIQIGSGNAVNSVIESSPVNIYFRRTVCQFVYTKAELNAAGKLNGDTIKEIGFFVYARPLYDIPGYTIKIKHTNQNNVNNSLGTTGWTVVKGPFTFSPVTGEWNMITLDQPFVWNGNQNIGIEICWSQVQPTWDPSGQVYIFSSNRGYRYSRTDIAGTSCGSVPGTRANYKPQIRFKFKDYTTWTGLVSSDWFNPQNWNAGVPNKEWNAVIPGNTPNQPKISGQKAYVKTLKTLNGSTLTIAGADTLCVYGDLLINGNFIQNQSTIAFLGTDINQWQSANPQYYFNVDIHKNNGINITGGMCNIVNRLDIKASVLNTNGNITLLSTDSNTARLTRVGNSCKYVIHMFDSWGDGWNGGYLSLYIDGELDRTYYAKTSQTIDTFYVRDGSSFHLTYTPGTYENENSFVLYDPSNSPIYSAGPPIPSGNIYSGTSSCQFSNPIIGNFTIERRIQAGATHWRFLTIPVQGGTLNQWYDDFIMSGFPGSQWPNWPSSSNPWPSIYYYDETVAGNKDLGFYPPSSINDPVLPAQGLWVWCGDTITGTQPFTIDVTGPPYVGPVSFPVSFTNSGSILDDGWNMVANPYPCTIDWDSPNWTKQNIDNAIYIWNPQNQQFAAYVNGIGVNGGSRYVASSQAFWVKANASNPQLIANEFVKVTQNVPFIKASALTDYLKLKITHNNLTDEMAIRFDDSSTVNFDQTWDAYKLSSASNNVPFIAADWNNQLYSVNTLPPSGQYSIPLRVLVPTNGQAKLEIATWSGLNYIACIYLEDLLTQTWTDLKNNPQYNFTAYSNTQNNRFILHVYFKPKIETSGPSCSYSSDATITINSWSGPIDTVRLFDLNNQMIGQAMNVNSWTFSNLIAGSYILQYQTTGICSQFYDTIYILTPPAVNAGFVPSKDTLYWPENDVAFQNTSQNANYFYWDFGDGDTSTLFSPVHSFNQPGAYLVTLVAKNLNDCKDTTHHWVFVKSAQVGIDDVDLQDLVKLKNYNHTLVITGNQALKKPVNIEYYDISGKLLKISSYHEGQIINETFTPSVKGVYLIKIGFRQFRWVKTE